MPFVFSPVGTVACASAAGKPAERSQWASFSNNRNLDQAGGYRAEEVRLACRRCLEVVVAVLNDPHMLQRQYRNSHRLVGAVQAVAAVQGRYPELLDTPFPLRCVPDHVPWM